jgi:hypothetical protein
MKPWVKRVIGILSHVPAAYILGHLSSFLWMLAHLYRPMSSDWHFPFGSLLAFQTLVTLVLLVFWLFWLWKASGFALEYRVAWALGLVFGAPAVMPVLYWVHLRNIPDGPYFFGKPLGRLLPWGQR